MAPGRIVTCVARVPADGIGGPELDAGVDLLERSSLDAAVYASTSSGYAIGCDAEEAFVASLARRLGIPVLATCSSAVRAVRVLQVRRLALVHPPWFGPDLNELGARFFGGAGIDVVASDSAALPPHPDQIEARAVHEWTARNVSDEAEAVFIGGNGFRAAGAIASLEETLGRPVLTANQVLVWSVVAATRATFDVRGFGGLFAH
jgi:maleate isomerase